MDQNTGSTKKGFASLHSSAKFLVYLVVAMAVILLSAVALRVIGMVTGDSSLAPLGSEFDTGYTGEGTLGYAPGRIEDSLGYSNGTGDAYKRSFVSEERADMDFAPNTPSPTDSGGLAIDSEDRKIIKNATVEVEVEDTKEAKSSVRKTAEKLSGYVVNESMTSDEYFLSGDSYNEDFITITLRVPEENFDKALAEIAKLGYVRSENITSSDVTEEYVDLQSRLKNLQAAEAQYLEILKSAKNVTEVLAVQDKLVGVRGQIESLQGRINYLDRTSDMSSITVFISVKESAAEVVDDSWEVGAVVKTATKDLLKSLQNIVDAIVYFAIMSPVIIITVVVPALIIFGVVKLIVKAVKKRKAQKTSAK